MRAKPGLAALSATAAVAGAAVAIAVGTAGAQTQTVTLGSTTGTPSQNICVASIACTYVPYTNVSDPTLQVPFDRTVTSFSVNSGSAGGTVKLRVLRPAGGGKYTGAGTSAPQTLAGGTSTFTVSQPVKKGDVLALDNDSSALMFDTSDANPITAYYQPALADGSTQAPHHVKPGYRLLMSAVVRSSPTTTTTTTTTGPTNTTPLSLTGKPPAISGARLTHKRFRVARRSTPLIARVRRGTTFVFTLSTPATVQIAITRRSPHRRHIATLKRVNRPAGANRVSFTGRIHRRALKRGRYRATLTATNSAGRSNRVVLSFRIVR